MFCLSKRQDVLFNSGGNLKSPPELALHKRGHPTAAAKVTSFLKNNPHVSKIFISLSPQLYFTSGLACFANSRFIATFIMFRHMNIIIFGKTPFTMQLRISHNSGIPLHLQVENLLRDLIKSPKYGEGALLPKEVDIARQLGISRNTVRQGISKLVTEGLVERKKGVGTKVAEPNISTKLESWLSFTQEMNNSGISFLNYEITVRKVAANKEVAAALEIPEKTKVIKLSRLRGDKEGPFVHFISWFHPRIGLTGKEDFMRPLYELLETDFSTIVVLSKEKIKAILVDKKIAAKLNISNSEPVLNRIRKVYDPGKRPIEYNVGYYRADKFSYSIDIQREFK